jgi:hypothetical protein
MIACPASVWVSACAYFMLVGWALSCMCLLGKGGYVASILVGGICLAFCRRQSLAGSRPWWRPKKNMWRFKHPLPAIYFLVGALILVGGVLYCPSNYDALTYRTPRVLNWLCENQWHWISGEETRVNIAGTGMEWLCAPLIALLGTDRPLFLLNALPYLLMPGLTFSVLAGLGISRRVAWQWMWLIPLGYGYALQAGSIGNDLLPALFFLASIKFALASGRLGRLQDILLALAAVAMCTSVKASNLPLLLPFCVALAPAWRSMLRHWKPLVFASPALLCLSFAPTAVLNARYAGKWDGDPTNAQGMKVSNPLAGVVGNGIQLAVMNLAPPVLPIASKLNETFKNSSEQGLIRWIRSGFPRFRMACTELAPEEGAGLGMGVTILLGVSALAGVTALRRNPRYAPRHLQCARLHGLVVGTGAWGAYLVFLALLGTCSAPRLSLAYYPLLMVPLILLAPADTFRKRWWQTLSVLAALTALPAVILTPSRPLWPALTILGEVRRVYPNSQIVARASQVYEVYRRRPDALAPLREMLPASATNVGFISNDYPETSLWRPFGSRRVRPLSPANQDGILTQLDCVAGAEWVVKEQFGQSAEEWCREHGFAITGRREIMIKVSRGYDKWFVAVPSHPARR